LDELLAPKGDAAVATGSTGCIHLCDVKKAHRDYSLFWSRRTAFATLMSPVAPYAACFRRKSARVNSMSWHNRAMPRARQFRMAEPLWRAPSLARTCPEAGLS